MLHTAIPYQRRLLLAAVAIMVVVLPVAIFVYFARRGWLAADRPLMTWSRLLAWLRRKG